MSIIELYFLVAAIIFFVYAYRQRNNPSKTIHRHLVLGCLTIAFVIFRFVEYELGYLVLAVVAILMTFGNMILTTKRKSSSHK